MGRLDPSYAVSRSHSRLGQHAAFGLCHVSARVIQRQVREYFRYLRVKDSPLVVNPHARL